MNSTTDSEISDIEPVDNYEEYEIKELENYEKEDDDSDKYEDEEETDEEDEDEDEEDEEEDDKEKKKTEDKNDEAELEDYETDVDSNEPYSEYSDSEEDIDIEQLQDNLFDVGIDEESDSEVNEDKIIKEICYYQNTTHNLIPREAFKLLCDEVLQDFGADFCFTKNAIDAIQVASEAYMIEILQKSNEIAVHSKRKTIHPKDVIFSKRNRTEY